jgi:hypothetical protein
MVSCCAHPERDDPRFMPPAKKIEDKYTAKASLWNLVISVINIGFYLY